LTVTRELNYRTGKTAILDGGGGGGGKTSEKNPNPFMPDLFDCTAPLPRPLPFTAD
jgi:hypothetical protein